MTHLDLPEEFAHMPAESGLAAFNNIINYFWHSLNRGQQTSDLSHAQASCAGEKV